MIASKEKYYVISSYVIISPVKLAYRAESPIKILQCHSQCIAHWGFMLKGYFHAFIHYPKLEEGGGGVFVGCGDRDHIRIESVVFSTRKQFGLQQVPWVKQLLWMRNGFRTENQIQT